MVWSALRHRSQVRRLQAEQGSLPIPTTAALIDADADEKLSRDGYVVVDLLGRETVAELLELCHELHPVTSGWETDFYSQDSEVKRRVDAAGRSAFSPALDRLFLDHRCFLNNFVVNWPGDDGGLVLHQHSSVVDERRFRSVIVWCALTDATEANGTLHVVPRSHRLQIGPSPERTGGWSSPHTSMLLSDHLTSVPVSAGQAIVFDNQLLHCSFANRTDAPRISMAAIVLPAGVDPLYFDAPDDRGKIRVHRLTSEFFLDNQAGDLEWAAADDLDLVTEMAWSPTLVEAHDVARLLPAGTCSHLP